ncbi:PREDICTED: uncharacterized protein LOC109244611 [Nicotiana attenuata]|uniref:Embryo defective 1923 n=1 Tax=Nicotiana attenuata TaxID=49451 RepID=A0A314KZ16_NICAT|nr:PREDICTED: uncharacterized protein LOC109244611 [Nicotiana attenuata]OIT34492.1 hypothetical protein A4A49_33718 [Nicotiana attenuata]
MSITLSALSSSIPSLNKFHKISSSHFPLNACPRNQNIAFPLSINRIKPFKLELTQKRYSGFFGSNCGFSLIRKNEFIVKAENGKSVDKAENEARGESTMPDRFRYLTKEAPDNPVRWPWFIALAFLLYAWRTVLWELSNWKKAAGAVFRSLVYIPKLVLAFIYYFVGDQITAVIRFIESTIYSIRAFYSGVVAYAPLQELTTIIILASCVLAIAEAAVPDSVNSQPYLLTAAGIMGFAAVRGYISELFFWFLLVGLFVFARFIRKRDYVSSALPAAAVLAAVGEPWIRMIVMVSYAALAVLQHYKMPLNKSEGETTGAVRKVPLPLICAALAIGVRLAAKWAGYRHLTWMIV